MTCNFRRLFAKKRDRAPERLTVGGYTPLTGMIESGDFKIDLVGRTAQRRLRRIIMRLVRFQDVNGRETFVNADRVNHVSDYGSGTTEINFGDKEANVYVAMEVSAVASTLLKAGNL